MPLIWFRAVLQQFEANVLSDPVHMAEIRSKGRAPRHLPVLRTQPYPPFALILRAIWFGALAVLLLPLALGFILLFVFGFMEQMLPEPVFMLGFVAGMVLAGSAVITAMAIGPAAILAALAFTYGYGGWLVATVTGAVIALITCSYIDFLRDQYVLVLTFGVFFGAGFWGCAYRAVPEVFSEPKR
ncbi:hypothetical protein [Epibacterium ulvae]|uniref:hypothetical protein n=1 Tax=Epibacterium ulvae TaxID=1156985 RepID=UPI00248F7EE5|nr:hypothetical protein [Epibacterium ulvae]